jgi:hypothetical protein
MPPLPSASRGETRAYAHVTILSDSLSPDDLRDAVGLDPDKSWAKGELRSSRGQHRHKFNGVEWVSTLDRETADPGDHIEELAERLRPQADRIAQLSRDERVISARLWLYYSTSGENPGFELTNAALDSLARLGVTLALDIYLFDEEDSSSPRSA